MIYQGGRCGEYHNELAATDYSPGPVLSEAIQVGCVMVVEDYPPQVVYPWLALLVLFTLGVVVVLSWLRGKVAE